MRRILTTLVAVAALATATACTPEDQAAANDPESATVDDGTAGDETTGDEPAGDEPAHFATMTVTRSGGIAGITETLEIAEDGAWTYVKARMAPEEGTLSEEDLSRVRALAADLAGSEASKEDGECADAFTHVIAVVPVDGEPFEFTTTDCAEAPVAAATDLMDVLVEATPL